MAEVLITLGIIGVVAALTMPSLIAKHQEKQTVVKLKKMYSVLSQAYMMYVKDNGPVLSGDFEWTEEGATGMFNVFKPSLKIAKDCGTNDTGCFYDGTYKDRFGNNWANYSKSGISNKYYKVMLTDGSSIVFRGAERVDFSGRIFYDVNGNKGPNSWGIDLFEFFISAEGNIFPSGTPIENFPVNFDDNCIKLDSGTAGGACTAWVIFRENMDYLHCDDLSWNGKSKCD